MRMTCDGKLDLSGKNEDVIDKGNQMRAGV